MTLLRLDDVSLAFAGPPLLDHVSLGIDEGERIGLLGRNGAGKSSLLRVLEGALRPDSGDVHRASALRTAALPQDVPRELHGPVHDHLREACGAAGHERAWEIETRLDQVAHDLAVPLDATLESLSAGSLRRVLLAAALVRDPGLLLLDEPTNHLDIAAIESLEDVLGRRRGALVFVTHDRGFLRRVATRILELDRGALRSYPMGYDAYVAQRDDERRVEAGQAQLFDRKLADEEAWLRQGIRARRTRNEGRVRALEALRRERSARRDEPGRVKGQLQEAERSGRVVVRAEDVAYAWGESPVVEGLTLTIQRGDRVGVVGPNGCGKTTLLALLLGTLAPQRGTVTHGTKLEIAHFEQTHDTLDDAKSPLEIVGDGRETLAIGGVDRHVIGYLGDFLFSAEQARAPVARLSGGERRRVQLAQVLSRPCNLLVLDEPTNDLDLETLELLEELLAGYAGTLLVVSHDRAFLDNVVTSTLAWDGGGRWREVIGGWEELVRQRAAVPVAPAKPARPRAERPAGPAPARKLGFKEKRELAGLPAKLEALEEEKRALFERLSSPGFYATRGDEVGDTQRRLAELEEALARTYERWLELESLAGGEGA